jgi:D-aminoacyl-tRNA deacylase
MRILIQRVLQASVTVGFIVTGAIAKGLLVLVGIEDADNEDDVIWLSNKIVNLRIFDDENNADSYRQPNISVKDIDGDILVVSQFTLQASTKKGNRPSYIKASKAEIAIPLYEMFVIQLSKDLVKTIQTGEFGADMKVALVNDGPVTIWIDSKNRE